MDFAERPSAVPEIAHPQPARHEVRALQSDQAKADSGARGRKEVIMTEPWVADLEAKHGMPLDRIPGHVYVLHYEVAQIVRSVSQDYAGAQPKADSDGLLSARPIRHYVGWTQQAKPSKRISRHGPAVNREVVSLQPGTTRDEQTLKLTGTCPKCGEALAASVA
jgi:hypothetical protein